jgi:hypothetical protein
MRRITFNVFSCLFRIIESPFRVCRYINEIYFNGYLTFTVPRNTTCNLGKAHNTYISHKNHTIYVLLNIYVQLKDHGLKWDIIFI